MRRTASRAQRKLPTTLVVSTRVHRRDVHLVEAHLAFEHAGVVDERSERCRVARRLRRTRAARRASTLTSACSASAVPPDDVDLVDERLCGLGPLEICEGDGVAARRCEPGGGRADAATAAGDEDDGRSRRHVGILESSRPGRPCDGRPSRSTMPPTWPSLLARRCPRSRRSCSRSRRYATPHDLANLQRFGITSANALGVSMANVQKVARAIGRDHATAEALWTSGVYEARLLAAYVDEPAEVTVAQMDRWCRDFDSWGVCDTLCFVLFDRTPHAWRCIDRWARGRPEFVRRAAFALMASLAVHDKASADACSPSDCRWSKRPRLTSATWSARAPAGRYARRDDETKRCTAPPWPWPIALRTRPMPAAAGWGRTPCASSPGRSWRASCSGGALRRSGNGHLPNDVVFEQRRAGAWIDAV